MIENPISFILIINSLFLIGLIFNQNETNKELVTTQNLSTQSSPLEKPTWICLGIQYFLLLVEIKS